MAFVALTPHQPGIVVQRWTHETKSIYPVIAGGVGASIALWCLQRPMQRHVLLLLAAVNTLTLVAARRFSGVMDPDRAFINAEEERRESKRQEKKMTDAKYRTRKKLEADRLLLASGTSLACGAWCAQMTMHTARVFLAPPAMMEAWRKTATAQASIAGVTALLMGYKCLVEAQIAYCHRWDL